MKVIHTGDWHIGKLLGTIHMTQDQAHLLDQFLAYVETEQPDVIVHTGDLYDRSIPPVEAVTLLNAVLYQIIVVLKIPMVIITGNHDSKERVGFAGDILTRQGLHIISNLAQVSQPIVIKNTEETLLIYGIPYVEPSEAKVFYEDGAIKTHEDVMARVIEAITEKKSVYGESAYTLCMAHGYVTGSGEASLMTSESERPLAIGGTEQVPVHLFTDFDYVALGHLHRPQKVQKETIRYAGSLMKYSFSEANQKKSVTQVDFNENGIDVMQKSFTPLRDVRILEGTLKDLVSEPIASQGNPNDYLMVRLTDEAVYDAYHRLRAVYPNVLRIEMVRTTNETEALEATSLTDLSDKDPLTLFENFYTTVTQQPLSKEALDLMAKLMIQARREA